MQTGVRGQFYNKEAYVQEVTANMIRAVSNLISEEKRMAWRDLRLAIRMKLMNGLLLAIEEMAFLLADVTQNPELLEEAAQNIILGWYIRLNRRCIRELTNWWKGVDGVFKIGTH